MEPQPSTSFKDDMDHERAMKRRRLTLDVGMFELEVRKKEAEVVMLETQVVRERLDAVMKAKTTIMELFGSECITGHDYELMQDYLRCLIYNDMGRKMYEKGVDVSGEEGDMREKNDAGSKEKKTITIDELIIKSGRTPTDADRELISKRIAEEYRRRYGRDPPILDED